MASGSMSRGWGWLKPEERDFEAVLRRLHKEASESIPGLSPDPKQADPVIVMLLRAFAREYVELYHLLDDSVGMAYRTLVSRLVAFPHAPEPATTALQLVVKDAGAKVPIDFEAISSQPVILAGRRSVQAHFSPYDEGVVSSFEAGPVALVEPSGVAWRMSLNPNETSAGRWQAPPRNYASLFLALDSPSPSATDPVTVFVHGGDRAVQQCLWSRWVIPASQGGPAIRIHDNVPEPFVPGKVFYEGAPFEPPMFTFRSDARRIRSPYEPQFVKVGGEALLSQACPFPRELGSPGVALSQPHGTRHWVRVDLPPDVDLTALRQVRFATNAVLAANRELRTSGAINVDATPIHTWLFPETVDFDSLLRLERVIDLKSGHLYQSSDSHEGLESPRAYRLVEWLDGERRALKVELLNREDTPRASQVEIVYSLTLGTAANGLEPGTISQVFTPPQVFPGLLSVNNLVPAIGGRPARTADLQEDELRAALRHRGRTVVASDYLESARAFDPDRVTSVSLGRGVARGPRGLRSTVRLDVELNAAAFVSAMERESFRLRLEGYLQDRSAMGECVEVRLAGGPA